MSSPSIPTKKPPSRQTKFVGVVAKGDQLYIAPGCEPRTKAEVAAINIIAEAYYKEKDKRAASRPS